jgi:dTDP-4-dehydrorhamnose reductase
VRAAIGEHAPEVVINCAAMTDVRECEVNATRAWDVDVLGARNVAEAGNARGAFVVHFSSDHAVNPVNVYGRSKRASESVGSGLVLRCKVYDRSHWLFRELSNATRKVRVLTTSRANPITVGGLLGYVEELIQRRHRGVVNVGIADALSHYEFGVALCGHFRVWAGLSGGCGGFREPVSVPEGHLP